MSALFAPSEQPARPGRAAKPARPGFMVKPPRLSGRNGYSIFVGCMKVLLPAIAAALILLIVVWPQFESDVSRFRISVTDLTVGLADNLAMLNARFEGLDENNQPYSVTADEATQRPDRSHIIGLVFPKADISMEDGTWLALEAREGTYNRTANTLDLNGGVSLFHDRGFELHTDHAQIDLEASSAEGFDLVNGQGPFGSLESEGFRVIDRGDVVIFKGKSRMVLYPGAEEAL